MVIPDRRYAAVWSSRPSVEDEVIEGRDPAEHLQRAGSSRTTAYHPVALSVATITPEGRLVATSVWHRPVVSERERDRLAERQARAAIALVRLGKTEEVWPLLRHGPDPRLRSFIVNWLRLLEAKPTPLIEQLAHLGPARRGPSGSRGKTKDILFDRDVSTRRALILALGQYQPEELSAGERQSLVGTLLELYRSDPDAGIHGAAEWALRRWKEGERVKAIDEDLKRLDDRGENRWFVNRSGQTFAVIDDPAEFRMGSPGSEPDRIAGNEAPRRISIPRPSRSRPGKSRSGNSRSS